MTTSKKNYAVASADTLIELEAQVEDYIDEGYVPHGSLVITGWPQGAGAVYMYNQPMTKEIK